MEMDCYCLAPVYGAPESVVFEVRNGQSYQLFRRSSTVSREMAAGRYSGLDLAQHRDRMMSSLMYQLKNARAYASYAIGMPDEFIYRESGGKIVKMPQSLYVQLST